MKSRMSRTNGADMITMADTATAIASRVRSTARV